MKRLKSFFSAEDGATTIEALLWLPMFVGMLAVTVDVSLIFNAQSRILGIVQDVDRAYSVGRFENDEDTMARLRALLPYDENTYTVDTQVTDGIIETRVTIPMSELVATGLFTRVLNMDLTVHDYRYMES
ncbi:TadE family protein [Thioclava sp. DLFJ5-1]|uniref:TadE/TadG family type IV pilus assembly protein n=1 Tax=Thioclava sp. DLFJ5-1 TaxID=1915314 RepID=UPI001439862D|nr:TadE family protein [Thioclava sp. DLFJ5-1]